MAHALKAVIGKRADVKALVARWQLVKPIALPQEMAMTPLTVSLLDDIETRVSAAAARPRRPPGPIEPSLVSTIAQATHGCALGYIETDYFGGVGSQAAALWRNGRLEIGPLHQETTWDANRGKYVESGEPAINQVLAALGVYKGGAADEFAALGLSAYRSVSDV